MGAGRKVKCLRCGQVIQSQHRHDWVQCKCKGVFVDGGDDYLRMGVEPGVEYELVDERKAKDDTLPT